MTQDTTPPSTLRQRATSGDRPATPARSTDRPPIDTTSFYGTATSKAHGSSHTGYIAPEPSPFREPELVEEEPIPSGAQAFVPTAVWGDSNTWGDTNSWGNLANVTSTFESWGEPTATNKIAIDGRDEHEELNWYDPTVRAASFRPGPGVLPPRLVDMLHDPEHALYSVSPRQPDPLVTPAPPHLPSADEVRTAVPHPNAYFCREHNGWVFLLWKSSSVLPTLVKDPETPLPSHDRRKRTSSCVGDGEQPFGQSNVTHHWHKYEKVVDATKLNPPYTHGDLVLDLYLCCQCSMYCLVSDVIPGVIPLSLVNDFTQERFNHPAMDKTPRATVVAAWETIHT